MWNMYKRFAPNDKTWLTIIRLEYQEYLKNALDDTSQQFKLPFPKTIEEIEDRIWNFIFIVQALGYALSSLEEARAIIENPNCSEPPKPKSVWEGRLKEIPYLEGDV